MPTNYQSIMGRHPIMLEPHVVPHIFYDIVSVHTFCHPSMEQPSSSKGMVGVTQCEYIVTQSAIPMLHPPPSLSSNIKGN
ncbi:hypothetical protein CEXT_649241 [Caerostris extrusa]|uniref:Uncharacterized protein n=1 Tax=Caerostris extrusa TaxID=172846 RepID=A0AAV4NZF3_CAEEX|nr:hypothetical protein CEXT_649241 [Caerostris extrusa]